MKATSRRASTSTTTKPSTTHRFSTRSSVFSSPSSASTTGGASNTPELLRRNTPWRGPTCARAASHAPVSSPNCRSSRAPGTSSGPNPGRSLRYTVDDGIRGTHQNWTRTAATLTSASARAKSCGWPPARSRQLPSPGGSSTDAETLVRARSSSSSPGKNRLSIATVTVSGARRSCAASASWNARHSAEHAWRHMDVPAHRWK